MIARRLVGAGLLKEVRDLYEGYPQADDVTALCEAIVEASDTTDEKCAEYEDVRDACDKLVFAGILERTAPETYRAGPVLCAEIRYSHEREDWL